MTQSVRISSRAALDVDSRWGPSLFAQHFRNFGTELPGRATKLGFQELGPKQTAQELFGHLAPGDKVAIVSRFPQEHAQKYVHALTERGLKVRFIQNQTGIQDFCFLRHTQKEMVGISISTYFKWAALLSNASRIVAYSLDVPAQRRRTAYLRETQATSLNVAKRWTFRLFKPNESKFTFTKPTLPLTS